MLLIDKRIVFAAAVAATLIVGGELAGFAVLGLIWHIVTGQAVFPLLIGALIGSWAERRFGARRRPRAWRAEEPSDLPRDRAE